MDPLAEKYAGVGSYTYCVNNPINLIDPDGRGPTDWFVNNLTGDLVFVKGQSTISQKSLNSMNLKNSSPNDFERLGSDNMFGSNVDIGSDKNVTSWNRGVVTNPEGFMRKEGYEKAKRVTSETKTTIDRSPESDIGANIITTRVESQKVLGVDITYVNPSKLNKEQTISTSTEVMAKVMDVPILKRETSISVSIIPYNQNIEQKKGSADVFKSILTGTIDLIKSIIKSQ